MTAANEWAKAYARQADADFTAWELYEKNPKAVVAECHKLLFLQMACEKLCKAHVIRTGIHAPDEVQTSHGFVAKHLPSIMRQEIAISGEFPKNSAWAISQIRQLSEEIEILNPAMTRDNKRPDNCEYPWEYGGKVLSPLDHSFAPTRLVTASYGRAFIKLLRRAINGNL